MASTIPCKFFAQDRCTKGDECTFSHVVGGKAFGKGKTKGKSKGSAEGGKGHTLPRVRITAEKFSGTVEVWKGKYGWIKPAEEIDHEKASQRNGSLYFGINDLEGAEELADGTPVEFHIFEDDSGLGAEEVVAIGEAPEGFKSAGKGKQGKSVVKGAKGTWSPPAAFVAAAKGAAAWAPTKGVKGAGLPAAFATKGAPAKGMGKDFKGKGKDGKGKGKDGKRGKGHLLARTRISDEKFTGTVTAWKGKYGWLTPAEEIPHEKATKHNGGLFVSVDNIEGVEALTVGAMVEFHIWEDADGLGAEEVVQF